MKFSKGKGRLIWSIHEHQLGIMENAFGRIELQRLKYYQQESRGRWKTVKRGRLFSVRLYTCKMILQDMAHGVIMKLFNLRVSWKEFQFLFSLSWHSVQILEHVVQWFLLRSGKRVDLLSPANAASLKRFSRNCLLNFLSRSVVVSVVAD